MNREKVVIIIPTYNESAVIAQTLAMIFQETSSLLSYDVHVLVFDSNSSDGTASKVLKLKSIYPRLHLKTEAQKSGLGSAYLQAMRFALDEMQADVVIECDADLSHQPKYIVPMLLMLDKHDVVLGSRYVKGGSIPKAWGFHRKLLSVVGNYIARFLLTYQYKDFTSGFRVTHRRVLASVLPRTFLSNHYAYKLQLLWLLHQGKARIVEFPIEFIDREQGVSKLPANSVIDSLCVLLKLRFYELQRYFKMCLVGASGALIQFFVYNGLRYEHVAPITATQCAVLLAITNNFLLNHLFTFNDHREVSLAQNFKSFLVFLGYSAIMVSVQSYWLALGIRKFGHGFVTENLIIISGMMFGSVLNYLMYSKVIFSNKKSSSEVVD
jgi:dolichol-phosphate mannosyltransferase